MFNKAVLSSGASILALILAGCGGSNSASPANDGGTVSDATVVGTTPLPCDVTAVVQSHCQSCHGASTSNGAPMSLVTWEDFHAAVLADPDGVAATAGEQVYQMAETRLHDTGKLRMPPVQQPVDNAILSAADLATLDAWIANGAPQGDGSTCTSPDGGTIAVPDGAAPELTCTSDNLTLAPTADWAMPQTDDDDYVCYSVTPTVAAGITRHVLGMTPHIDNTSIVHHVLLFEADATDTSTVTTVPSKCSPGGSLSWRIVYGWAPGGGAMQTPPDVGFPYDGTTKFIVQVHYNNIKGLVGQKDHTGFSFCTTDQPIKYDADVMAFGSMNFTIPPNGSLGWTCPLTLGSVYDGLHVFAAFPHMHQLGTGIQTEQTLAGGGIIDMGRNDPWDFNSQVWFPLGTTLHQGDVVTTRCVWQNNTGAAVGFGQNTENEMCYSFTAYYPKTTQLVSWAEPSLDNDSKGDCYASDAGLPTPDGGWFAQDSGATFTPSGDAGAPSDASTPSDASAD